MTLSSPVVDIRGVGQALAAKLQRLGITTVADLINYFPRRYDDYSQITHIRDLSPGPVTIQAVIKQSSGRYVRRRMHITEAVASDESGSVRLLWFNQPYRLASLKAGSQYFISGLYELSRQRFLILNPSVELVSDVPLHAARILAVYRETKGLTSRQIRVVVHEILPLIRELPETLPTTLVERYQLLSRADALVAIHAPRDGPNLAEAQRRLGFEEVLQLTLASQLNKRQIQAEPSLPVKFNQTLAQTFVAHLPFQLTDAQRKTIWQIYLDLQRKHPMNRLVEGDVGSGKTVVATMAGMMVIDSGWQVALMAPTELLARQHAETVHGLLCALGYQDVVVLLVGGTTKAQKKKAQTAISNGQAKFIVGTQALIQDAVDMHALALVVIDEQHRFGVDQRRTLLAKAGHMPHVLSLTATPIPRSLALTLYGELDLSLLDEMPSGRRPVITEIISPNSRDQMYKKINLELKKGRQMFVVCPLITGTDKSASTEQTVVAVYRALSQSGLQQHRIGVLHGKLKAAEKQTVMQQFVDHQLDILVATTVVEVGVDIPNASIMLIEGADRFGLAQLHQLRGRVGRGRHQSYCYLMMSDSQPVTKRLRAMQQTNDGFRLAELDLELRGPGAIYGTDQHGPLDLRIAKLTDTKLIAQAQEAAKKLLDDRTNLLKYSQLMEAVNKLRAVTRLN